MERTHKVALVTNVTDYTGPPAVNALLGANFRVLVHDMKSASGGAWNTFSATHAGAERADAETPDALIQAMWGRFGRADAIVSVDFHRILTRRFRLNLTHPETA